MPLSYVETAMKSILRRRVAAVAVVLALGAGVVWTLATLNAAETALSLAGPGEDIGLGFGGPTVDVGVVALVAVVLLVGVFVWRRSRPTRDVRSPPRRG